MHGRNMYQRGKAPVKLGALCPRSGRGWRIMGLATVIALLPVAAFRGSPPTRPRRPRKRMGRPEPHGFGSGTRLLFAERLSRTLVMPLPPLLAAFAHGFTTATIVVGSASLRSSAISIAYSSYGEIDQVMPSVTIDVPSGATFTRTVESGTCFSGIRIFTAFSISRLRLEKRSRLVVSLLAERGRGP